MTDKYKGIVEIEINGTKRGFKFGTRSMALFADALKIPFGEIEKTLKNPTLEQNLTFFWAAAAAYSRINKIEEPTIDEVADWIDNYGITNLSEAAGKTQEIPNVPAPETAGQ